MTTFEVILAGTSFSLMTYFILSMIDSLWIYLEELEEQKKEKQRLEKIKIENAIMKKMSRRTGRFLLNDGEVDLVSCRRYMERQDQEKEKRRIEDIDFFEISS